MAAIGRSGSVVAAARLVRLSRDRATYRLRRLARAFGRPVLRTVRGGAQHGSSRLTPLGAALARRPMSTVEVVRGRLRPLAARAVRLRGVYGAGPPPTVRLERGGPELRVAFDAADGSRVDLWLDPEAILLARRKFPSSARNVLRGTVVRGGADDGHGRRLLPVRVGGSTFRCAITAETEAELGLVPGAGVYLYIKATALAPVASTARRRA